LGSKFNNNHILYEDLLKKENPEPEHVGHVIEYHDYYSIGNNKIKCKNLGEKFASINSYFLDFLREYHIPGAYIKSEGKNSLLFQKYDKFPFSIRILNIIDKRTAAIFNKKEFDFLVLPLFELHYGCGKESLISESHLVAFDLCNIEEIKTINRICSKINAVLKSFFERRNSLLAEVTCFFGKNEDKIFLVGDFTPPNLKVIPLNRESNFINPYKFETASEIKQYTDHLFNLMST
jgi:phosphoribosylaminoimidazole-succinocarboxamide synthase